MTGAVVGRQARKARTWTRLLVGGPILALLLTGLTASEASAGPPTSVTVQSAALTTTAAGGDADWTVGFTVSASGAMPGTGSSWVTVNLPTGSSPGPTGGDTVVDVTSGQTLTVANCLNSGTSATCYLNYENPVSGGDVLSFTLDAVTNPSTTGSNAFTVATSADTQPASGSATITTAQAVTGVTATETSTAASAQVAWTVGFTASSTGALEGTANSAVTVTLPAGTTFASYNGGYMTDITTSDYLDYGCTVAGGTSLTCPVFLSQTVNPGDVVSIVIRVVTNPSTTGPGTVQVRTSSDLSASTPAPITADQAVTGVSVAMVSTAANALTTWTIGFTTSSTGGLDSLANSTITLVLPAGTSFPLNNFSVVTDTTTNQMVSAYACTPVTGSTVDCPITPYNIVHAGDTLSVLLRGVTNPTAGPDNVSVSTTSDLTSTTAPVTITAAQSVTGLTVAPSSTGAGVTTNWTFGFKASSTGAIAPYIGNVTLTLPPGTTFGSFTGGWLHDTTTNEYTYNCSVVSGTTVSCLVYFPPGSSAGDAFTVILDGVTNTLTTGPATVSVSTSSDTKAAKAPVTMTGVTCGKVSGKLTGTISLKKCTPKSPSNKSAKGPGASLTSSGTLRWKKSHQTTVLSTSVMSVGQGGCKAGSTERDVTGSVTGGSSTYTHSGQVVHIRLCQKGSGAVSLVPGTTALL